MIPTIAIFIALVCISWAAANWPKEGSRLHDNMQITGHLRVLKVDLFRVCVASMVALFVCAVGAQISSLILLAIAAVLGARFLWRMHNVGIYRSAHE